MYRTIFVLTLAWLAVTASASICTAAAPAVVVQINGAPTVKRGEASLSLEPGMPLNHGDVIETNERSKVRAVLADDSVLTIGPDSRVGLDEIVVNDRGRTGRLHILAGSFKLALAKLLSGTTDYVMRTPTAVVGVRGTVVWGDVKRDAVCSLDGEVEVRSVTGGAPTRLSTGKCVQSMGLGSPVPFDPTPAQLQEYLAAVTLQ